MGFFTDSLWSCVSLYIIKNMLNEKIMNKKITLALSIVSSLATTSSFSSKEHNQQERPNILLILSDDHTSRS